MKPALLIFELRMMGDAVMSMPFIRAAQNKYSVFVCCQPSNVEVFQTILPSEQIIGWRPPWMETTVAGKWAAWRKADFKALLRHLRIICPHVALGVWGEARTHVLLGLTRAPVRIGFPMNKLNLYGSHLAWRRRQIWIGRGLRFVATVALRRQLLTHKVRRNSYLQHHLEDWRQIAEVLDLPWDLGIPWLQPPPVGLPEEIAQFLSNIRLAKSKLWLWHLGARWEGRRWPVDRVKRVVQEFFLKNQVPLLLLRSPEVEKTDQLTGLAPIFQPANIAELAMVLSSGDYVICNDTGIGHLAAALGKRIVTIFSAGMPEWIAPFGNTDNVVRRSVCPYHPCLDRCFQPSFICRDAVSEDLVINALRRLEAGTSTTVPTAR